MAPTKQAQRVLTLDDITAADDRTTRTVDVPEWGGSVVVRGLTLEEARDIQKAAIQGGEVDETKVMVLTVSAGCVDPVIPREQAMILAQKRAGNVIRLCVAINELTGASPQEVDAAIREFREG